MTGSLPASAREAKPTFFDEPALDALVEAVLALTEAQWVVRHRLARLEHWAQHAVEAARVPFDDAYLLPAEAEAELAAECRAFIDRLLDPFHRASSPLPPPAPSG